MKLSLYYFPTCPFCIRVTRVIEDLGVDVEVRNIHAEPQHRYDLIKARGRGTVPVLRIEDGESDEWMPESADIVRHLRAKFGAVATPA